MISDTERREAARKLRNAEERTMMELTDGELLDLLAEAVGLDRYESEHFEGGLFYCLADLIDRPTCDVRMGVTGHVGVCMRCGAMVEMRAAVFDATEALPTRYCANCGAEVNDEVD